MRWLRPKNGMVWCPNCEEGRDDFKQKLKVGDDCPTCWDRWGERNKLVLDKRTVLGPQKAVEITGNPLEDAARILKSDGWVRGEFVCARGKKCLDGAVRAACLLLPEPEMEQEEWAKSYVMTREYQRGRSRAARAEILLAEEILRRNLIPLLDWSTARGGMPMPNIDTLTHQDAIAVITTYNDAVISHDGKRARSKAIRVLRDGAEKWNPRTKLPAGFKVN